MKRSGLWERGVRGVIRRGYTCSATACLGLGQEVKDLPRQTTNCLGGVAVVMGRLTCSCPHRSV